MTIQKGIKVKAFDFTVSNYTVRRNGDELSIWFDDEENYSSPMHLEITIQDILGIIDESTRLYDHHHPSCNVVSAARYRLENSRSGPGHEKFDDALKAYMDIATRHRENTSCKEFH